MDSGDPAAGTNALFTNLSGTIAPAVMPPGGGVSTTNTANFGQRDFEYTPPTGYKALNTANLPAPDIADGSDYFNTVTYTGDGTSSNAITGVGFQPDWVWLKSRSLAQAGNLIDAVRGVDKYLRSSSTAAEATFSFLSSFDTDGFTLGTSDAGANQSSATYVAWNWLGANGTETLTAGSINSTVSANPTAGFSIVSYTGNGTAGATVAHGLGVAPSMIIIKNRSDTTSSFWCVYHKSAYVSASDPNVLYLNSTQAQTDDTNVWGSSPDFNSTTFEVGDYNGSNGSDDDHIAYCFAEVEGYSKFGSYTGNGSTDGVFIHLGFKPSFFLLKATSVALESWSIFDSARDPDNFVNRRIMPNNANQEEEYPSSGSATMDFLSNGVKLRASNTAMNGSGVTFIYAAFAENPFGGSGVSPVTAR